MKEKYLGLDDREWFDAITRDLHEASMNLRPAFTFDDGKIAAFRSFELDSPRHIDGKTLYGETRYIPLIGGEAFGLCGASMNLGWAELEFAFEHDRETILTSLEVREAADLFGGDIRDYFAALADRHLGEQMDSVKGVGAKKQAEHDAAEARLLHQENPDWGTW